MISFSNLGNMGRLGNQLFQYAFIRSVATKLGVKFWCPQWEGDEIFDLNDSAIREQRCPNLAPWYAPDHNCGWLAGWQPMDDVDYVGYFVSPRYLPEQETVRDWFYFRDAVKQSAIAKNHSIPFDDSIALHVRLEDHTTLANYYNPRIEYYRASLNSIDPHERKTIIVFSDEPARASRFLRGLQRSLVVVSGNSAAEDLYLMSSCSAVVVAASSFSWWGAFLSRGRVICPSHGMNRPGAPIKAQDPWPPEWLQLDAGLRWYDHVHVKRCALYARRLAGALRRRLNLRSQ